MESSSSWYEKKFEDDDQGLCYLLDFNRMSEIDVLGSRLKNDREWRHAGSCYTRPEYTWNEWQTTLSERSYRDDDSDNESLQSCQSMFEGFKLRPKSAGSHRSHKQTPARKIICRFIENSPQSKKLNRKSPTGTVISQAVFPDEKDPTVATPVLYLKKTKRCSLCHRPKCTCKPSHASLASKNLHNSHSSSSSSKNLSLMMEDTSRLNGFLFPLKPTNVKPPVSPKHTSPQRPFYSSHTKSDLSSNGKQGQRNQHPTQSGLKSILKVDKNVTVTGISRVQTTPCVSSTPNNLLHSSSSFKHKSRGKLPRNPPVFIPREIDTSGE